VAAGELKSEVAEPVVTSLRVSKIGDDGQSERITAGTGEMLPKQISSSLCLAGAGSADHFDVVALPVHLSGAGSLYRIPCQRLQVGESETEAGVGGDRPSQCNHCFGAIGGSLRPAVRSRRLWVRADGPTMILDRSRRNRSVVSRAAWR
jgi:hypothetical protein